MFRKVCRQHQTRFPEGLLAQIDAQIMSFKPTFRVLTCLLGTVHFPYGVTHNTKQSDQWFIFPQPQI